MSSWDDGKHTKVKRVQITYGDVINSVEFEYDGTGNTPTSGRRGSVGSKSDGFTLKPDEYIEDVTGYYTTRPSGQEVITALIFKTNHRTLGPYGNKTRNYFSVNSPKGNHIVGFQGSSSDVLHSIDVHFGPIVRTGSGSGPGTGSGTGTDTGAGSGTGMGTGSGGPEKVEAQGGQGGKEWDDKADHNDVRKIAVGVGRRGVHYIKFDYDKSGQLKESPLHGSTNGTSSPMLFEINHPDEYLVSVVGYIEDDIIQGLRFRTNKKESVFGYEDGSKFTLEARGKKIVGFHGKAERYLNALGAYFAPITSSSAPIKLEAQGGKGGQDWDDGAAHDGVRKIAVGVGRKGIHFIKLNYIKSGQLKDAPPHGSTIKTSAPTLGLEFEIDHPDEYLISVMGYHENDIIQGLQFKTNKKESQVFGYDEGTKFTLEVKGSKIVGFHGKASSTLHQIGVYVVPINFMELQGKWVKLKQQGTGPGARSSHAIALVGDKMYSFGGEFRPNTPIDNKLYVFDLKTHTWSIAPATGDIPDLDLIGLCMVSVGSTLYVFGGRNAERKYSGFYSYNTLTNKWKLVTPLGQGPAARSYHSMTADDKTVYVFGGVGTTARIKTLDAYNVVDGRWVQLPTPGESFRARGAPGLAVVEGKIWVVYGFCGEEMDDVHFFDPVKGQWTSVETKGEKPTPRSVFATAVVGKHIVIFGGEIEMDPKPHIGPGKFIGDTFALDTETFEWKKLDGWVEGTEEERPGPRGWCAFASASIDARDGLLMYGGNSPTNDRVDDIFFFGTTLSA